MRLSIVTTLYHSAPYIREFYERMAAAAAKVTGNFEIIFVNDGSPDNSLDLAIGLHNNDSRIVVIDLSRNFGHHNCHDGQSLNIIYLNSRVNNSES